METLLRAQIDFICLAVLAVASFSVERGPASRRAAKPYDILVFRLLVLSTGALLALDAAGWLLDGQAGRAPRLGLYAANSLYFAIHVLPTILYLLYADYQINRDPERTARIAKPLAVLASASACFALSSPFSRLVFFIDDSNRYVRGPAFGPFAAYLFGLTALSLIPVFAGRKKTNLRVFLTLLAYPVLIVGAATAQNFHYGLVLVWPATTVFLVAAALNIHRLRGSIDHLTGIANRRSLDEELELLVRNAGASREFGGILADLDEFKAINDRLGHDAGDRALEDAAAIFRSAVRKSDFVARYGGDEFLILVPGATESSLAELVGRLTRLVESHNVSSGRPYGLSFSLGAACYDPSRDGSPSRFLARLDAAMYADKAARKASGSAAGAATASGEPLPSGGAARMEARDGA